MSLIPTHHLIETPHQRVQRSFDRQGLMLQLGARGRVVKAGKRVIVTSADVTHIAEDGTQTPCAVLQQTVMPVQRSY